MLFGIEQNCIKMGKMKFLVSIETMEYIKSLYIIWFQGWYNLRYVYAIYVMAWMSDALTSIMIKQNRHWWKGKVD